MPGHGAGLRLVGAFRALSAPPVSPDPTRVSRVVGVGTGSSCLLLPDASGWWFLQLVNLSWACLLCPGETNLLPLLFSFF